MPFQSEKQRRYMHANLPDIGKRWERGYSNGGRIGYDKGLKVWPKAEIIQSGSTPDSGIDVSERDITYGGSGIYQGDKGYGGIDYQTGNVKVNVQEDGNTVFQDTMSKDDLYNLYVGLGEKEGNRIEIGTDRKGNWTLNIVRSFNQGGLIPSHEAGIYGLAEGGVTDIGFSKVKPSQDGSRPGYFTAEYGGGDTSSSESIGGEQADRPAGMPEHLSYTAPTKTTTTTDDGFDYGKDQEEDVARMMKDMGIKDQYNAPDYGRGWVEAETDYGAGDYSTNKDLAYNLDFMYGHKTKPKDQWTKHNKQNAWIEKKQLAKDAFDAFKFGIGPISILKFGWQQSKKKKAEKEHLQKMIDRMKEAGMTKFSPHSDTPLQLAEQLMIDMTTTKKDKDDTDDKGQGVLEVSSITYDDMEDTNKRVKASTRWRQEQKEVDRSKQMAYWRMMMSPYMGGAMGMAAEGGRVPGGYNTGGLSNLFRLKNR